MRLLLYFAVLTQLLIVSSAANDEDQWQVESIEESQQQISQAEEAIQDESNASVRRSSRLASKSFSALSIIDWPLPNLLETWKQVQKRKNLNPASTSADATPKRVGGPAVSARAVYSSVQSNDPVLSALSSIQYSLSEALESVSTSKSSANLLFSSENSLSATARLPMVPQ
ncbi:hypothetical protein DPX16_8663 [Anabarilius grahami]|uniref:Uncharacterized protein n=1 Tax=Anabarilius grahami TaxID=495550 RepID=A0A3N0Y926_ANAGA|nr:hypothetical protein DPX16_8663 [Anabarilius grahami]